MCSLFLKGIDVTGHYGGSFLKKRIIDDYYNIPMSVQLFRITNQYRGQRRKIYYCRQVRLGLWQTSLVGIFSTGILGTIAEKTFDYFHEIIGNNLEQVLSLAFEKYLFHVPSHILFLSELNSLYKLAIC